MPTKLLLSLMLTFLLAPSVWAGEAGESRTPDLQVFDIAHTVVKLGLASGVTPGDAAQAMESKAVEINMKLVGRQNVGAEVRARGLEAPILEIFQFCNPEDAVQMVRHNTIFAAYMPCRIAMVEDRQGQVWLEMLNLDLLIGSADLPPALQEMALRINGQMLDIMTAGATGEF